MSKCENEPPGKKKSRIQCKNVAVFECEDCYFKVCEKCFDLTDGACSRCYPPQYIYIEEHGD